METTAGTVDNVLIQDAILAARAAIREGDTIADPLAASKQFPPMVVQMITIGEETGQLDAMLEKVAIFYEGEVDAALESLTSAIEPLMIVGLGGVVLFILIALWMPLIAIIQELSG
jgi:type IV pilus assembly protein PilC